MSVPADRQLQQFAHHYHIEGLTNSSLGLVFQGQTGYTVDKATRFLRFQNRINNEMLTHRVITNNLYTAWFKQGMQSLEQVKEFIVQFSVFSNQFLVAQLLKTINADSLEGMRASKEILANEIGVVFNTSKRSPHSEKNKLDIEVDPELVSTEGTVEGGIFHFRAAHFEWLLRISNKLELKFNELGKRKNGTSTTLFFCDELARLYGSDDYQVSQSASYAVENWAAAGFWDELIEGLTKFNQKHSMNLPLAFFTWHSRLEAQHARHTQEELEELYFTRHILEDEFILHGNQMLDGVAAFWDGLNAQRIKSAAY